VLTGLCTLGRAANAWKHYSLITKDLCACSGGFDLTLPSIYGILNLGGGQMPFATIQIKREYQRQWKMARRVAWFKDKVCTKCGATESLELHHRDPKTKVTSNVWSWAKVRRDAELAKCDVLCWTCHRDITSEQNIVWFSTPLSEKKHGTDNTYNRHHCRCEVCREWKRSSR
jgi:hypothetical protein